MTDTLFYVPPCDSPRLRWMKKHGVIVNHMPAVPKTCNTFWHAASSQTTRDGTGPTEDDAIADWAKRNGVRLWNEESIIPTQGATE